MSQENKYKTMFKDKRRIYNECSRKKGYPTTKAANKDIRSAYMKSHIKLSYYKCDYCGKYHLTKKYVKTAF